MSVVVVAAIAIVVALVFLYLRWTARFNRRQAQQFFELGYEYERIYKSYLPAGATFSFEEHARRVSSQGKSPREREIMATLDYYGDPLLRMAFQFGRLAKHPSDFDYEFVVKSAEEASRRGIL